MELREMRAFVAVVEEGGLRVGVPLELPGALLSTSAQTAALHAGELDLGLLRERPAGSDLDAVLVLEERLGVVLATDHATNVTRPDGVRLDALAGLTWVGFPRSGSPAWFDELTAVLRSHGLDHGPAVPDGHTMIAEVKLAAVSTGGAFTLAPPGWPHPLPDGITWLPLVGHPIVRRTWAVWPAHSHRRDLGALVASLARPAGLAAGVAYGRHRVYRDPNGNTRTPPRS